MTQFVYIKNDLISNLWLSTIESASSVFFPRLKKNKNMKLFSLTTDENFREISCFISEKISTKDLIFVWNHDRLKVIRLESEGLDNVYGATRYEDSIMNDADPILSHFPFDVLNLDFYSQNPEEQSGRFEKEISSIDQTLYLQYSTGNDKSGFVLLYTTIVDGNMINYDLIKENSNRIGNISGWFGLSLSNTGTLDLDKKIQISEDVIMQFASKYGYELTISKKIYDVDANKICSLACVFRKPVR